MPTGYTAPIYEGDEDFTFVDYALSCARAFGALIHQRDDDLRSPIRLPVANTGYHDKAIAEATDRLAELEAMTEEDFRAERDERFAADVARWEERVAERREMAERYDAMRRDVKAWAPPTTEHVELKNFMLSQIDDSAALDCLTPDRPVVQTVEDYASAQVERAQWSLDHHTEKRAKEIDRATERRAWIAALADSLRRHVEDAN